MGHFVHVGRVEVLSFKFARAAVSFFRSSKVSSCIVYAVSSPCVLDQ